MSLTHSSPTNACAGGPDCAYVCTSFFSPDLLKDEAAKRFRFPTIALERGEGTHGLDDANSKEWVAWFGPSVASTEVEQLLKLELGAVDPLIKALKDSNQRATSAGKLVEALGRDGVRPKAIAALYYWGFARRCEPFATVNQREAWEYKPRNTIAPDVLAAETTKLIAAGERQLPNVADPFLIQRYHLQILRLLFYSGRYAEVAPYYDKNRARIDLPNSVGDRALDLVAGALYRDHQYGRANYLFSRLYDRSSELRETALRSFHPQEESDWADSLARLQTPHEREVFWQMFGIQTDGAAALAQIYAINPKSDFLPILLVRSINKIEAERPETPWHRRESPTAPDRTVPNPRLIESVTRIWRERKVPNPWVWGLGLAYLRALNHDLDGASADLAQAKKLLPRGDSVSMAQGERVRIFIEAHRAGEMSAANDRAFARNLAWLDGDAAPESRALKGHVLGRIRAIYVAAHDTVRALLAVDDRRSSIYQEPARLDALIDLVRAPRKTELETYLVKNAGKTALGLADVKAIELLLAGDLAGAAHAHDIVGGRSDLTANADPFKERMIDWHEADALDDGPRPRLDEYLHTLDELERAARAKNEAGAKASYRLATGLYDFFRFERRPALFVASQGSGHRWSDEVRTQELAERYYKRALELATDLEFKAKAAFMAAKAEHNVHWKTEPRRERFWESAPPYFGPYFDVLRTRFSRTKYYAEILSECGWFRTFTGATATK